MLTIEYATLHARRQMGSALTKRIETSWDTKPLHPFDPFDVLYAPAWIYTLRAGAALSLTTVSMYW